MLNIDAALAGLLAKLYSHNMQFDPDETIKGDAQVIARGATSLMQQESLRMRRNEALQATNNPTDLQIMGLPGRAELLRKTLDDLDVDTTKMFASMDQLQAPPGGPQQGQPPQGPGQQQMPAGPSTSQEVLPSGHPTTDNFSPNAMTPQGYAGGGLIALPDAEELPANDPLQNPELRKRIETYNDDKQRFRSSNRNSSGGSIAMAARREGIERTLHPVGGLQPQTPDQPSQAEPAKKPMRYIGLAPMNAPSLPSMSSGGDDATAPNTFEGLSGVDAASLSTRLGIDPDPLGRS